MGSLKRRSVTRLSLAAVRRELDTTDPRVDPERRRALRARERELMTAEPARRFVPVGAAPAW